MFQISKIGQKAERFIKNHTKYQLEGITKKFCDEEIKCTGQTIIKPKTPFQFTPERIDILTIHSKDGEYIAKISKNNKKGYFYDMSKAENIHLNKHYKEIQEKAKLRMITAEEVFSDVWKQINDIAKEAFNKF